MAPSSYELLQLIHSGTSTYVIRARAGDRTYIIKENSRAVTSQKKLRKYFREFMIGSAIDSKYVVKYVDMKRFGYGFAIIMEDIGGTAVKQVLPQDGFAAKDFLPLAIDIVKGLSDIHAAGVIHRDINPHNIVVNLETGAVNIIDFDIASRLSKEDMNSVGTHQIQGTLLYMSPEQTGRMNRHIDYRSDFYSLGATFYEMVCGKPPFRPSIDPLELIHKHIAVTPKSPWEIRNDIPKPLSDVILKLMAKNAEDRYQDCQGILADLEDIYEKLKSNAPFENYIVGGHDQPRHFQVSQKLYGRSEQTVILTNNFDNISSGRVPIMMMLVHGYSGVGKTTLVNEVHKPLVRDKGYYVYGKFNQFSGNVPYAAFIQALKQLMQQLLSESEEKLAHWRELLQSAVGKNGQVVIDVIPEFELVVGPQPPVTKLSAIDSHNRFKQIFIKFMSAVASHDHPLVIFIDDLQWADPSTLAMLSALLLPPSPPPTSSSASSSNLSSSTPVTHLLVLGAYRENEVSPEHPFVRMVEDVRARGGSVQDLVLQPLGLADVTALVHDTCAVNSAGEASMEELASSAELAEVRSHEVALAKAIHEKTEGNPFFINQLFTMLYQDGHVTLQTKPVPHWVCNMAQIKAANYTNNVVDLMVTKLRRTPEVQAVLGIAAQIGNQFDLSLLTALCGLTPAQSLARLRVPIQENFIVAMDKEGDVVGDESAPVSGNLILTNSDSDTYPAQELTQVAAQQTHEDGETLKTTTRFRFGHDRIQQASASLVPPDEVPKIHLRIAEQLLIQHQDNQKQLDDVLLFLVNHLNQGFDLEKLEKPCPPQDKHLPIQSGSIAKLNLMAATKSKNTNAFVQALIYIDVGLSIMKKWDDTSWQDCYEINFALHILKAEISTLVGDYEQAERIFPILFQYAKTNKDKCSAYLVMYYFYEIQNHYDEVLATCRKGLVLYDIEFPEYDDEEKLKKAYDHDVATVMQVVKTSSDVEKLKSLPFCRDESILAIMQLLQAMWIAGFVTGKQRITMLVSSHIVTMSMKHGLCEESTMGFSAFGLNVGPNINDYRIAHAFGKLAVELVDMHYPQTIGRGHVYLLFAMYNPYCAPLATSHSYLQTAFESCVQTGDVLWACYVIPYITDFYFFAGTPLYEVIQQYAKYKPFLQSTNNKIWIQYNEAGSQVVRDLMGDSNHFLGGEPFKGSPYEKAVWLNVTSYYTFTLTAFYMQEKQNWLFYADRAMEIVPKVLPCLFKEYETRTIVPLIYLDWISRSPLVHKLYRTKSQISNSSPKLTHDNRDVENEQHLSPEEQIELLDKRLDSIFECLGILESLSSSCECNFQHKLLLIQAECARVSIILGNTAIFDERKEGKSAKEREKLGKATKKGGRHQDFEEAMELYESAIASARTYGFTQYEVLALELYALFWLTAPARPKEHVASGYLVEAIFVCERWGATAKAQHIRTTYATVLAASGRYDFVDTRMSNTKSRTISATQTMFSADLETIVQASQAIANEADVSRLIETMIKVIVETSGAQRGTLFTTDEGSNQLLISGEYNYKSGGEIRGKSPKITKGNYKGKRREHRQRSSEGEERGHRKEGGGGEEKGREEAKTEAGSGSGSGSGEEEEGVTILAYEDGRPFEQWDGPQSVVNFSKRTLKPTLLPSATDDYQFGNDPYIVKNKVKSVLCMPIMVKNKLKGTLYLENNLYEGLFNKHRMDLLLVLTSQMAITLENTRFFNAQMKEQMAKLRLEQVMMDEERQRLRADAAEKYRLQLENFVDMICHEIRNPLNGILGNADLIFVHMERIESLLLRLKAESQETEYYEIYEKYEKDLLENVEHIKVSSGSVNICAEHQKCITDDVLQLSKLRANKLVLSNNFFLPSDVVNTVVRMFSVQAANKGLEMIQSYPEGNHARMQVWTDGMRITQIVTNIVSNAVKFTHKGYVKITVRIGEDLYHEREGVILHNKDEELMGDWIASSKDIDDDGYSNEFKTEEVNGIAVQSCYLKVTIEDTGIGMTEEEQARIFTRFSQANNRTSKEYGGSGLGLAICKILARQMGGYLYVESKKGVGSTFHLSVHCKRPIDGPLSPNSLSITRAIAEPSVAWAISESRLTSRRASNTPEIEILVVEDNLMNQLLLNRILKIKGYKVTVANNGQEGFEAYKTHSLQDLPFTYILMDIQMPVMDGLESTIKIRNYEKENALPPATIIGLSGNARDEYKDQAIAAGMNFYITKPYHKEILFSLLQ